MQNKQNMTIQYFIPFVLKKCENQSPQTDEFKKHKINVFIVTKYGRPIFVRYGDEIKCSSFLATLSTIFNKIALFYSQNQQPSTLNKIKHKNLTVYLLQRKHINYICLSKVEYDEIAILSMLDFLNMQVISCLTDGVNTILQDKPTYDPSINFSPHTINLLSSAIKIGLKSPCIIFNSIPILCIPFGLRTKINNLIKQNRQDNIQIIMLMTLSHVIALNKSKDVNFKVQDAFILFNLLQTQKSLRNSENWITICLPGISCQNNIFCYTNFITQNLILVMLVDEQFSMFYQCSSICKEFKQKFLQTEMHSKINQILTSKPIQIEVNFEKSKLLKHFLIKNNNLNQIVMSSYNYFGKNKKQFKQILNAYAELYRLQLITTNNKKQKMHLQNKKDFIVGAYNIGNISIYFIGSEYMNLQDTKIVLQGFKKWIKQEESNLFIQNYS